MKEIKFTNSHRKKHFAFFSKMDQPHFSVCANVDITKLNKLLKAQNLAFTPTIVYLISKTANAIPEFKQRIREDIVVEHDWVHPSFTVTTDVEEVFSFCEVKFQENYQDFVLAVRKRQEEMKVNPSIEDEPGRDDYLFLSSFPWASFTNVMHPMHYHPVDSVPRIVWGKFFHQGDRLLMPLSVQAHHAVVDGIHIGKYFQHIQGLLDEPTFLQV